MTSEWWRSAACADRGLELFFGPPEAGEPDGYPEPAEQRQWRERRALKVCAGCPVRQACLDEALAAPLSHQYGVRGGMTESQRRGLMRRMRGHARATKRRPA